MKGKMTWKTKRKYLSDMPMPYCIMFWLGCLRFGRESTRKGNGHSFKEVGIYVRWWSPLMAIICVLIAIYLLLLDLKHTFVEWVIDR